MNNSENGEGFEYSAQGLSRADLRRQCFFEMLPGLLILGLLGGMVLLSWLNPVAAIVCIIAFDLFWLCFMGHHLILILAFTWLVRIEKNTEWMKRITAFPDTLPLPPEWEEGSSGSFARLCRRASEIFYRQDLIRSSKDHHLFPDASGIFHVVIISISDEPVSTLTENVESLLGQNFPVKQIMVILAVHEGAARSTKEAAWKLHREYYDRFLAVYVAPHSTPSHEEVQHGGGGAVNYAARLAVEAMKEKKIDLSHVIVTCLKASAIASPRYLSCLAWNYIICPDRDRACFQAVPVYRETVWEAPGHISILHIGSSFFLRVEATSPHELVNFASYSVNLNVLTDIGYWPEDNHLADDSALFWKAYLHYEGNFQVVPLNTSLLLDIGDEGSFWKTILEIYRHQKMKAWAISNLPIIFRGLMQSSQISRSEKIRHIMKILTKHLISATWMFMLFGVGWLPVFFARREDGFSSLGYFAPRLQAVIFTLAFIGLAGVAVVSLLQLPRRPEGYPLKKMIGHVLAWLIMPFFALALTSFPSLEVQFKMMCSGLKKWLTARPD